ncbi:hypothetical protein THAPSDRAFT_263700, partial [Thalassiosira pseudonana CCMP1335]
AFTQKLLELQQFKQQTGHTLVPKRYEENPSLGNWVNKQRQNYRKYVQGMKGSMNENRVNALKQIGFIFDASTTPPKYGHNTRAWQTMYNKLSTFHQTHGHCRVPSSSTLGQWAVRQRFLYRQSPAGKAKSSLTQERIDLLNSLDFAWTTRSEELWQQRIQELQQFKLQHGHCLVPRKYDPNPSLSAWVATQRKNYNRRMKGQTTPLTVGRMRELEKMGFV